MRPTRKLLVLASTFPASVGDTEPRFVYDLCQNLKDRFSITVLAPSFPGAQTRENMNGLDVVRFRYAPNRIETLAYPGAIMSRIYENRARALLVPFFFVGMHISLRKLLNSEKYDAVHSHWLIPQGIIQSFFTGGGYPPYLLTGHGGDVFSLNKGFIKKLKQRALSRAAKITVVSEFLKNNLLKNYNVNTDGVSVIPMGTDLQRFSPHNRQDGYYRDRYDAAGLIILFVGRLAEKKGINYLLQAVSLEPLKNIDFTLIIVGDGPLNRELAMQASNLSTAHKVKFAGAKTHDELPALYANADVFCAPSITAKDGDNESWGLTIVEASASGIPVVTTRRGDDETVINGKTGLVVEQKNPEELARALAKLLVSSDLRRQFGQAGIEHVKQFGWETVSKKYADILEEIIQ